MQQQLQEQHAQLQQQMAQMHQQLAQANQQREQAQGQVQQSIEQAEDDSSSSSEAGMMTDVQQQIQDCKKWEATSNSITKGGLYCNDQSGQMFRCLVNPLSGNDISQGGCPEMQAPPMLMV